MKLFYLLLLISITANAQSLTFKTKEGLIADAYLGTDKLGSSYFARGPVLFKEFDGKHFEYQNLSLGNIHRIDLQNPLYLVLFYKNMNTAVILDNQLNEIRKFEFNKMPESPIVTACSLAGRNQLWIFDDSSQKVGLYDTRTSTFSILSQSLSGGIKWYQSNFNYFFWLNENGELWRIDLFGKLNLIRKFENVSEFQLISDSEFIYKKGQKLVYFSSIFQEEKEVYTFENSATSFWYSPEFLTIFTDGKITNIKLKLP